MKISNFESLQTIKTNTTTDFSKARIDQDKKTISFQDYLMNAVNTMNNHQLEVSALNEKIITEPESVDIHDVTIAMAKARQSLNLAQSIVDRLIKGWSEITTTR